MNLTGRPSFCLMPKMAPPLAVPSSLARMMPVHCDRLLEHLGLGDGVLAGGGVEDQQHLVRRPSMLLADHAVDLLQLAHQVGLRVQPAGGVHDQHVEAAGLGLFAGVVGHAGRVAALLVLDDLAAEPLAPDGQLLDGGRPEGVAGGHHHLLAVVLAIAWPAWRWRSSCPSR